MTQDHAINLIRSTRLGEFEPAIAQHLHPSTAIKSTLAAETDFAPGESKLGGLPHVPPDFTWPTWVGSRTHWSFWKGLQHDPPAPLPLSLVAQINCRDIALLDSEHALPADGVLSFFYELTVAPWGFDPKHAGSARVFHFPSTDVLRLASSPAEEPLPPLRPCQPHFDAGWTLPSDPPAALPRSRRDAYYDFRRDLRGDEPSQPDHHLLGDPSPIQNPMALECQLASNGIYCGDLRGYESSRAKELEPGASDWRLLLQIDTDELNLQAMWGDCGMIYFWIRRQDLARRDFSRVWCILQCS